MNNDARVERCRLAFVCGQRWEELEQLPNNEQVRFCQRCQSSVHLAASAETFAVLAAQGCCVAVAMRSMERMVGRTVPPHRTFRLVEGAGNNLSLEASSASDHTARTHDPKEVTR
jgi:alpha-tubulin suppressor-like RCC1 family protein